jgi:hypothetical protein
MECFKNYLPGIDTWAMFKRFAQWKTREGFYSAMEEGMRSKKK